MTDLCFHCGMKIDEGTCPCQDFEGQDDFDESDNEFDELDESVGAD